MQTYLTLTRPNVVPPVNAMHLRYPTDDTPDNVAAWLGARQAAARSAITPVKSTRKVETLPVQTLSENAIKFLKLIAEKPGHTEVFYADELGVSRRSVRGYIVSLRENGVKFLKSQTNYNVKATYSISNHAESRMGATT